MTLPKPTHVVTVTNQSWGPGANARWITTKLRLIGPFTFREQAEDHMLRLVEGLRRRDYTMDDEVRLRWDGGVWFVEDEDAKHRTLIAVTLTQEHDTVKATQRMIRAHFNDRPKQAKKGASR